MKYIVLTLAALGCLGMGLTNAMSEKEQQNLARLLKESPNGFRNALVKLVQQDQENKKGILADAYNVVKNSQRGKETFDKIVRSIIKNKNTADDLLEQLKSGDADKLKLTKKVKDLEDELDILKGITGAKPEDAKKIKDLEQEIQDLKEKIENIKSADKNVIDALEELLEKRTKEIDELNKKLLAKLDPQLKKAIKAVDDALAELKKTPKKGKKGWDDQVEYNKAKDTFDNAVLDFKALNAVEGYDENLIKTQVDEAAGLKFEEKSTIDVEIENDLIKAADAIDTALEDFRNAPNKGKAGSLEQNQFNAAKTAFENAINAYRGLGGKEGDIAGALKEAANLKFTVIDEPIDGPKVDPKAEIEGLIAAQASGLYGGSIDDNSELVRLYNLYVNDQDKDGTLFSGGVKHDPGKAAIWKAYL